MTDHTPAAAVAGHRGHEHDDDAVKPGIDTAECPVMPGRFVVKAKAQARGWVRDYNGRTYWLCCAGCVPKFDADPAKYAITQPITPVSAEQ